MRAKSSIIGCAAAIALLSSFLVSTPEAHALDPYQSREGVFGGLALGGGYGFWVDDGDVAETGPGFQAQGVLGTGVSEWWTVGVEADWWTRTVSKSEANEYTFHHGSVGGVGHLYLTEWFYLDAGAGFAYGMCSGQFEGGNCTWRELGLSAQGGVGFEAWFNGTLAGVANLDYTHHFYMHQTGFGNVSALFGLRWY